MAKGTHPPCGTLFNRDVMYEPSNIKKTARKIPTKKTLVSHITSITTTIRTVVISITHITATPKIQRCVADLWATFEAGGDDDAQYHDDVINFR
ncbi:hypothetical protein DsansV1_C16g0139431 [Dioscorea sansibarensis]